MINFKSKLFYILTLLISPLAQAEVPEGYSPCGHFDMLIKRAQTFDYLLHFNAPVQFSHIGQVHNGSKKWRIYWGTYRIISAAGASDLFINAGTDLHLGMIQEQRTGRIVSPKEPLMNVILDPGTSAVSFRFQEIRNLGVIEFSYIGQPYSPLPVHGMEEILDATLYCKPIN